MVADELEDRLEISRADIVWFREYISETAKVRTEEFVKE
jgi:hypothetical protein